MRSRVDVAVVGAGTAGAAAALLCARRGLKVVCFDRGRLDRAGARWVNGVSAAAFSEAGVDAPSGPERLGGGHDFHLIVGYGPRRLVVRDHPVLEVDMRLLVARLQAGAADAGAELVGEVDVRGLDGDVVRTSAGDVRAEWVVDASGLAGAGLLAQPRVDERHLCAAAQEVREVSDHAGARAFCERHGVAVGEVACFTSVAGGYSIVNVRYDGDRVSILTGSIPGDGHPSGAAMLRELVASEPWIGEVVFGGARAIPVRRPFDRLAAGRVAVVGDAGCQVFPPHGSGIGTGMVAARVLADALADGRGVQGYAADWQRAHGGRLASYDLFRRLSQTLTTDELERMIAGGLMDPDMVRSGMAQTDPRLSVASIPNKVAGLAREPRVGVRMVDMVARMLATRALYARYPRDPARLPRWSRAIARVFRERPDVASNSAA